MIRENHKRTSAGVFHNIYSSKRKSCTEITSQLLLEEKPGIPILNTILAWVSITSSAHVTAFTNQLKISRETSTR